MSFSSKSSSGRHYKHGHYGNNHYQKRGFMDKIFNLVSSRSGSHRKNNYYQQQPYNDPNIYTQPNNQPNYNQNDIVCTKCNSQIPSGSKFCLQCGEPVNEVLFCTSCGEKLPSNALFCSKCGTKVTK